MRDQGDEKREFQEEETMQVSGIAAEHGLRVL